MAREPEKADERRADSDNLREADERPAVIDESETRIRAMLEEKYGPDVRLLAEDDDKLLSYLRSESLHHKRVALVCLVHFYRAYPESFVREAAEYIFEGDDLDIRSWCVNYLVRARDKEVTLVLRDCAGKLRAREARPGDDILLRYVDSSLGVPRSFAHTSSTAELILARLKSASE